MGLSKLVDKTRLKTFCGTPQYIAPEVVQGAGLPDSTYNLKVPDSVLHIGTLLHFVPFCIFVPWPFAAGRLLVPGCDPVHPAVRHPALLRGQEVRPQPQEPDPAGQQRLGLTRLYTEFLVRGKKKFGVIFGL